MNLLTLDDSFSLDVHRANAMYADHLNPGLLRIYRALGLASLDVESAQGMEIVLHGGRKLLDFSGSIGVLALGHNHPRVIAAERRCHENNVLDAIKIAPHKLQGALAFNLAQMLPDPLEVAFFTVSGAEAVEAAMKLCEKAQPEPKSKFITTTGSYHGKTHGALSVTTSGGFRKGFLYGIPREHVIEVEYGDLESVEQAIRGERDNAIIAMIVEPIQGESLRTPAPGYLKDVVDLCRRHHVLTIFDEVKTGMGRTGTFCAFEIEDVVPDVITLSKALGGGKRAIGAMVSSRQLFDRAYGRRRDCSAHTSTFSGLGESCAVAIETLNVYRDEQLVERARKQGAYLRSRLEDLQRRHPRAIRQLLGRGLLQGIRFSFHGKLGDGLFTSPRAKLFRTVEGVCMASMVRALHQHHDILVHFAASAPEVLHIMPPLIVERQDLDRLVKALDDLLHRGFMRLVADFVKDNISDRLFRQHERNSFEPVDV